MDLRTWTFGQVLVVSTGWVLLIVLVIAVRVWHQISASGGFPGVGAISFGILETGLLLFGPPLILFVFWAAFRRPRA